MIEIEFGCPFESPFLGESFGLSGGHLLFVAVDATTSICPFH